MQHSVNVLCLRKPLFTAMAQYITFHEHNWHILPPKTQTFPCVLE